MKIESHWKLKEDIILSFEHLKQWNSFEALKIKETGDKNGENVPAEITKVVLVHSNIVSNNC